MSGPEILPLEVPTQTWEEIGPANAANGNGHLAAPAIRQLPKEFWEARLVLAGIRDAARSRLVAPDAVLGAVLARVAAFVPHTLEVPAIVGSPVGLTTYVAIVGAPETGKSAAAALSAELLPSSQLPAPAAVLDGLPLGSGEGMVEVLFEMVAETDDDGKAQRVKRQTRHAAVFHVDEGAVVADLGGRRGATLLPTLRAAWTHSTIGSTNASAETRRALDGRSYVFGLVVGIQPELAGPLLADAAGGLPQRFLWLSAADPEAPDEPPSWRGSLAWRPPDAGQLLPLRTTRGGWARHSLPVAPAVVAEIRAGRLAVVRGEVQVEPLDAHRSLLRLKVAALLALLDERQGVTEADWRLAGMVVAVSRRVRAGVEMALQGLERRKETAAAERHVRREEVVEEAAGERAFRAASRAVGNVVVRHAGLGSHADQGGGCVRTCANHAIKSKDRALVVVDEVLAEAERQGWISCEGGRWVPGESRPA